MSDLKFYQSLFAQLYLSSVRSSYSRKGMPILFLTTFFIITYSPGHDILELHIVVVRDCLQLLLLILSNFKQINKLLSSLKSSENLQSLKLA